MGLQIVLHTSSNTVVNDVVQENEELFIAVYKRHISNAVYFVWCQTLSIRYACKNVYILVVG